MLSRVRPHLTYANVVSTACLFVLLGGTSYAVATGSIDSREIKNDSIRGKDIRNDGVASNDIKDGSLLAEDFRSYELPPGPRGAEGPPGANGAPGTALAYARVLANGTVDTDNSKGITQANVTATGSVYCIANLGFTPRNAVASQSSYGVIQARIATLGSCPAGSVEVITSNSNGTFGPQDFMVAIN